MKWAHIRFTNARARKSFLGSVISLPSSVRRITSGPWLILRPSRNLGKAMPTIPLRLSKRTNASVGSSWSSVWS